MAVDNEELISRMMQVAGLVRRDRRVIAKSNRAEAEAGHPAAQHEVDGDHTEHGIGGHRNHGGSGHHGQNRVLTMLSMKEGISQKDLAYLLGIRPQSLGQALDRLEERGLIERRQGEDDRRVYNVYLTDDGRRSAAKVTENRRVWAQEVFSVLSEDEKESLSAIMDKLYDSLNSEAEQFGMDRD